MEMGLLQTVSREFQELGMEMDCFGVAKARYFEVESYVVEGLVMAQTDLVKAVNYALDAFLLFLTSGDAGGRAGAGGSRCGCCCRIDIGK